MNRKDIFLNNEGTKNVHFVQFLMFFKHLRKIKSIKDFVYKHKKRTILHQVALNGHLYLLKALISVLGLNRVQTSFNVDAVDEDHSTAFLLGLKQKKLEFVKYLLRFTNVSSCLQIYSDKYGYPLHVALNSIEFKIATKILKLMPNTVEGRQLLNRGNEHGNTPLHLVF